MVGIASDGEEALRMIAGLRPKMLVLDLMMPKRDGLSVLKAIAAQEDLPITVATTSFLSTYVSSAAGNLGVRYVMRKPCDLAVLADRLEELRLERYNGIPELRRFDENSVEQVVTETLCQLGVPAHTKGYRYLREAIILAMEDRSAIDAVTKVLYPHVAKVCGSSANRVERDIRHAINLAWVRGNRDAFRILLNLRRKPTNSELIALIADKINLQSNRGRVSNF